MTDLCCFCCCDSTVKTYGIWITSWPLYVWSGRRVNRFAREILRIFWIKLVFNDLERWLGQRWYHSISVGQPNRLGSCELFEKYQLIFAVNLYLQAAITQLHINSDTGCFETSVYPAKVQYFSKEIYKQLMSQR